MRRGLPMLGVLALLCGCGQSSGIDLGGGSSSGADVAAGVPLVATKNTTRIAGGDPATDAAAVALAVFPGSHPSTVALADGGDWHAALAASVLISAPTRAPLLLSDGGDLGGAASAALAHLHPARVVRVGQTASPDGYGATTLRGSDPFALAASVAAYVASARHSTLNRVLIASADAPKFAMPAVALAAKTGAPILFVKRDSVPAATHDALARLQRPRIYVIGPGLAITRATAERLKRLGTVKRIAGRDPVEESVALARFSEGEFGWGIDNPGHGLVFANDSSPVSAAAAAALSASGTYGPLLLLEHPDRLDGVLANYLLTIQPGYVRDPAKGVYNHGWLIGDGRAISPALQANIDALLEIAPVNTGP